MIQRIQTLFLLLASGSFGALFGLPLATSDKPTAQFLADKVYNIYDHPVLLALTILGILMVIITIFLFRNRRLQLKLGYLIISLSLLLPVASFLLFSSESDAMDASVKVSDQPGMFLPVLGVLFVSMANHYIKKDERLVKSMDRLR